MALADQSITGNPEIYSLFAHRLPAKAKRQDLIMELEEMVRGRHQLVAQVPEAMRGIIRNHLQYFLKQMPPEFDPQGASIGNLILAAGYLEQERNLHPVIYIYSKLAEVRGVVQPVVEQNLHLVARLEDGQNLPGQHLLTGKYAPPISSAVQDVYLSKDLDKPTAVQVRDDIKDQIAQSDLICYPMGSFYSSLIANLLPQGIGSAIAGTSCPKVYIPNPYFDPEAYGLDLNQQILTLLAYLQKDQDRPANQQPFLDYILLDEDPDLYPGKLDADLLQQLNIEVLRYKLVTTESAPRIEPHRLLQILLSLT
jgi:CofD-related protein of GAK system